MMSNSADPKRPDVIQLKVGRAVNLVKRLDQWDKQCGSKIQIPRGWWPGMVEDDDGTGGSLLKGNIKAGDPGPFCHRVERLVHIELTDLSLHTPYLSPGWPNNTSDPSPGAGATSSPKKTTTKETTCLDCECGLCVDSRLISSLLRWCSPQGNLCFPASSKGAVQRKGMGFDRQTCH